MALPENLFDRYLNETPSEVLTALREVVIVAMARVREGEFDHGRQTIELQYDAGPKSDYRTYQIQDRQVQRSFEGEILSTGDLGLGLIIEGFQLNYGNTPTALDGFQTSRNPDHVNDSNTFLIRTLNPVKLRILAEELRVASVKSDSYREDKRQYQANWFER